MKDSSTILSDSREKNSRDILKIRAFYLSPGRHPNFSEFQTKLSIKERSAFQSRRCPVLSSTNRSINVRAVRLFRSFSLFSRDRVEPRKTLVSTPSYQRAPTCASARRVGDCSADGHPIATTRPTTRNPMRNLQLMISHALTSIYGSSPSVC